MAIHTELPIYRTGVQLLALAIKAQEQMPRGVKRSLGDKIAQHCVEMLDLMALANATQRAERARHIEQLMTHLRAITVLLRVSFDSRYLAPKLWAQFTELLGSIGKQGGGWLKSTASEPALRKGSNPDPIGLKPPAPPNPPPASNRAPAA